MPKYAVLIRYEVTSGLLVDAKDEDEAALRATEFEGASHEELADSESVRVVTRYWGDGTVDEPEAVESFEEAEELLEDWIAEDDSEDEDLYGEDDEFDGEDDEESEDDDADDEDEDDDDEDDDSQDDDDEDDDAADELDMKHDTSHDAEQDDEDFGGEIEPPASR